MRAYVSGVPCIGFFYRHKVTGEVVYAYGGGGQPMRISVQTEERPGSPCRATSHEVAEFLRHYELMPGVIDFPDAWDPRLPYEFDLWYDIKRTSELVRLLASAGAAEVEHLYRLCGQYGLNITPRNLHDLLRKYSSSGAG